MVAERLAGAGLTTEERELASPSSRLPLELVLRILSESAQASSTRHARNVCLVCREGYQFCWPALYRIVAIRGARQLKSFSEAIYPPDVLACRAGLAIKARAQIYSQRDDDVTDGARLRLRRMQDALTFLYVNNNKDGKGLRDLATDEKPEMWMISILLAASNLKVLHFEEYWSLTYPWEDQSEKPLVAYPLMLLSRFTAATHAAFIGSPNTAWVKRILKINAESEDVGAGGAPQAEDAPTTDIYDAIMALERAESLRRTPPRLLAQPTEVTLSALAVTPTHLLVGRGGSAGAHDISSKTRQFPANEEAFNSLARMHLYFAKLTPYFCDALMSMPVLSHLRLTRPFADRIIESVVTILERGYSSTSGTEILSRVPSSASSRLPPLKSLIIETGIYMDASTIRALQDLETSEIGRGRLHIMTAESTRGAVQQQGELTASRFADALERAAPTADLRGLRLPSVQDEDGALQDSTNTTSSIVNYVTSSEQRGFEDFVARAHGHVGVWSLAEVG